MALYNEINLGRYSAILHKLLSMKEGAPAPQLAPDIQAMIALEVEHPEWMFLAGIRPWMLTGSNGAGAGVSSQHRIRNPANSGVISVVLGVEMEDITGAQNHEVRYGCTVTAPAAGTSLALDSRYGQTATTIATAIDSETVAAITGTVGFRIGQAAAFGSVRTHPGFFIVLDEGASVFFVSSTQNQTVRCSAWGYERAIEPSEKR